MKNSPHVILLIAHLEYLMPMIQNSINVSHVTLLKYSATNVKMWRLLLRMLKKCSFANY
jgi:hypothetical protein